MSTTPPKLIHLGLKNYVNAHRVVAVIKPDSAPVKRMVNEARERGLLVSATQGRKARSVVVMDSGHLVLSLHATEALAGRLAGQQAELPDLPEEEEEESP